MTKSDQVVKAIGEWPAGLFYGFACATGALLILVNSPWAVSFGAADSPKWLRMALTTGCVITLAIAIVKTFSLIVAHFARRNVRRTRERNLRSMTIAERRVLAKFMNKQQRTASFIMMMSGRVDDAVTAKELMRRGYLYEIISHQNDFYVETHYGISDDVFQFLTAHPEAFGAGQAESTEAGNPAS